MFERRRISIKNYYYNNSDVCGRFYRYGDRKKLNTCKNVPAQLSTYCRKPFDEAASDDVPSFHTEPEKIVPVLFNLARRLSRGVDVYQKFPNTICFGAPHLK